MKRLALSLLLGVAPLALAGVIQAPAVHHGNGPEINTATIPAPVTGYSDARIRAAGPGETTNPNVGDGSFREPCSVSHYGFSDPLVYPGQPDRSHLHVFFGNTGTNAFTTNDTLIGAGNSTCAGGIVNRSAYWVPAMIDTRDGSVVRASSNLVYYKSGWFYAPSAISALPPGLRMIAGNARATGPEGGPTQFECMSPSLGYGIAKGASIPNCAAPNYLLQEIYFPQCWDGINLDSPDHKSHMSYMVGGKCPAMYPVVIPDITFNVRYDIPSGVQTSTWRLASDMYPATQPGGFSSHGDLWVGWRLDVMNTFVTNCVRRPQDCHAFLLGDGRALY